MKLLRIILLLLAATTGSVAQAEWRRAESPNFVVYGEGSDKELRRRILLLEDYDWLLRLVTGLDAPPSPNKLHVYLVASESGLRQIRPELPPQVVGFYSASPHGIAAVAQSRGLGGNEFSQEVLLHEYAHHFMLQYSPSAYPAWYREGFAEYFMTARFDEDRIELGRFSDVRAGWLADTTTWMPIERLLFSPERARGDDVPRFYAQSWLLVHYFFRNEERRPQLRAYLNAIGSGQDSRKAFETHFNMTPADLTRELRSYVRRMTFSKLTRKSRSAPPPVTVSELGASDTVVYADAALRIGARENGARLLAQLRRSAASQTSLLARRVLAKAEVLHGDGAAADALLDSLIASAPQEAELLYLRGMRHLLAGRRYEANRAKHFAEARIWFSRAHKTDGNHFQTLYRYAESLATDPRQVSENTTNVLLLARQLAPQVDEITLHAAGMLVARGHHELARALLLPLVSDLHDEETAAAAKALYDRAQARLNAAPTAEERTVATGG